MTNTEDKSPDTKDKPAHPVRDAFDHATRWFGNLLAPLIIITYAKDAEQGIESIMERPLVVGIFAFVFVAIFAYNIVGTLKIQLGRWNFWRKASDEKAEDRT